MRARSGTRAPAPITPTRHGDSDLHATVEARSV